MEHIIRKKRFVDLTEFFSASSISKAFLIVVLFSFCGNVNGQKPQLPKMSRRVPSQLLYRKAYTTSYNRDTRCPNWVMWQLTREHTNGPYPRKGVPYYDDNGVMLGVGEVTSKTLRNGYVVDKQAGPPRQEHDDWTKNVFNMSHGHMCPAGDCRWSKTAVNQTFLLTNICPQDRALNNGDWKQLEDKCRKWANKYGSVYIVAGPIFYNRTIRTIGENKVRVPDAFFKVVLCMKGTPKAIGFIYPNNGEHHPMNHYVRTVDEVERVTGIDFFSNLPQKTEKAVECCADITSW